MPFTIRLEMMRSLPDVLGEYRLLRGPDFKKWGTYVS
jgi:hypothetical protein